MRAWPAAGDATARDRTSGGASGANERLERLRRPLGGAWIAHQPRRVVIREHRAPELVGELVGIDVGAELTLLDRYQAMNPFRFSLSS